MKFTSKNLLLTPLSKVANPTNFSSLYFNRRLTASTSNLPADMRIFQRLCLHELSKDLTQDFIFQIFRFHSAPEFFLCWPSFGELLSISTSKRVLRMPFAPHAICSFKSILNAKTTFCILFSQQIYKIAQKITKNHVLKGGLPAFRCYS